MKNWFFILFLTLISCEIKTHESSGENRPLYQTSSDKFVFVVAEFEKPKLIHDINFNGEINYVDWKNTLSITDIEHVKDFNEDKAYQMMDKLKKSVLSENDKYQLHVDVMVTNPQDKIELSKNRVKINSCKYYSYDTYKEASLSREKFMTHGK